MMSPSLPTHHQALIPIVVTRGPLCGLLEATTRGLQKGLGGSKLNSLMDQDFFGGKIFQALQGLALKPLALPSTHGLRNPSTWGVLNMSPFIGDLVDQSRDRM